LIVTGFNAGVFVAAGAAVAVAGAVVAVAAGAGAIVSVTAGTTGTAVAGAEVVGATVAVAGEAQPVTTNAAISTRLTKDKSLRIIWFLLPQLSEQIVFRNKTGIVMDFIY
jgi:hypothetical protein